MFLFVLFLMKYKIVAYEVATHTGLMPKDSMKWWKLQHTGAPLSGLQAESATAKSDPSKCGQMATRFKRKMKFSLMSSFSDCK